MAGFHKGVVAIRKTTASVFSVSVSGTLCLLARFVDDSNLRRWGEG